MEKFRHGLGCLFLLIPLLSQRLDLCASFNDEGRVLLSFRQRVVVDPYGALSNWVEGEDDSCSWFGVECSNDGRIVALNLKDLLLEGTLTPEIGKLTQLKSLILHNNSFCGTIPKEIGELKKLEILDLGHNNLSGPFPSNIKSILSLQLLILRTNGFMSNIPPELTELSMLSELLVDDEHSSSNRLSATRNTENATIRRLLQESNKHNGNHLGHRNHNTISPASAPSPSPIARRPMIQSKPLPSPLVNTSSGGHLQNFSQFHRNHNSMSPASAPLPIAWRPMIQSKSLPSPLVNTSSKGHLQNSSQFLPLPTSSSSKKDHNNYWIVFLSVAIGSAFLIVLTIAYLFYCRTNKVVTVMPWRTGLSGQLQKAFVTGVPSLRLSELESACEDFSNVVGTLSDCFLYKGTLSSGVEIAVTSTMVSSSKDWSDQCEAQFRNKISDLSKVNHKNFMNLIGYCEEEEPFTRMMVYEYAPNGTLFEHLHIKEADHLDWAARLRIIMGVAYCLEHMHQLSPPAILKNLNSSSIYLCDDYAAKISDLSFSQEQKEAELSFESSGELDAQLPTQEGNVYKVGIILLEIISGRLPFCEDDGLLVLWASSHLNGKRPLMDIVDTTLESFGEEDVTALCEVIKSCINKDPKKRPAMGEVVAQLRQITAMTPDAASPKLSPLWWAELEIISTESNSLE